MTIDNQTGLVLEGGGMRGVFTCGVLDYLMDRNIRSPIQSVFLPEHVTDSLICHGNADVPNTVISICWKSTITSVCVISQEAKHSGFRSSFYRVSRAYPSL